jgi:zinc finger SWIM domain-containing protein 3
VHNGNQPKTIYTNQDVAMAKVVKEVFLEAWHGICTFHIMQKSEADDEESSTSPKQMMGENDKESSILADFSACMFEYEDEEHLNKHLTL